MLSQQTVVNENSGKKEKVRSKLKYNAKVEQFLLKSNLDIFYENDTRLINVRFYLKLMHYTIADYDTEWR